jgi:hypothetical protein
MAIEVVLEIMAGVGVSTVISMTILETEIMGLEVETTAVVVVMVMGTDLATIASKAAQEMTTSVMTISATTTTVLEATIAVWETDTDVILIVEVIMVEVMVFRLAVIIVAKNFEFISAECPMIVTKKMSTTFSNRSNPCT